MKINDLFEIFLKSITESKPPPLPPTPWRLPPCSFLTCISSRPGGGWDRSRTGRAPGRTAALGEGRGKVSCEDRQAAGRAARATPGAGFCRSPALPSLPTPKFPLENPFAVHALCPAEPSRPSPDPGPWQSAGGTSCPDPPGAPSPGGAAPAAARLARTRWLPTRGAALLEVCLLQSEGQELGQGAGGWLRCSNARQGFGSVGPAGKFKAGLGGSVGPTSHELVQAECHPYGCLKRLPCRLCARHTGTVLLRCALVPGPAATGAL